MSKILFCFFVSFLSFEISAQCKQSYEIVVCAVFQNEEFFLKEWLDHHIRIGVDHFYLYDNGCSDASRMILEPYISSGHVSVTDWFLETHSQEEYLRNLQLPIYNQALDIIKEQAAWAAFIDIDEFIIPVKHGNLKKMLKEFSDYPAIAVNWQVYGTSGLHALPSRSFLTQCLVRKGKSDLEVNQLVKMIVQPKFVACIDDPHFFTLVDGCYLVNGDGQQIETKSRYQPICIDTVRINHYWFGTEQWFRENKLPRRAKWGLTLPSESIPALIDLFNTEEDLALLTLYSQLETHENL